MLVPRFTIRRWMLLVFLAALALSLGIELATMRRRATARARARQGYQTAMKYLDFGRITLAQAVLASERLMNAELTLCRTNEDEIAVISAHLRRARDLIEAETRLHPGFHHDDEACIAEAEAALSNCNQRLSRLRSIRRMDRARADQSMYVRLSSLTLELAFAARGRAFAERRPTKAWPTAILCPAVTVGALRGSH